MKIDREKGIQVQTLAALLCVNCKCTHLVPHHVVIYAGVYYLFLAYDCLCCVHYAIHLLLYMMFFTVALCLFYAYYHSSTTAFTCITPISINSPFYLFAYPYLLFFNCTKFKYYVVIAKFK